MPLPSYVLITPARNEAQYLDLTLRSVVEQGARPVKWVIVSDGSTDGTDELVMSYAARYPWIELVRMPERQERHFAAKVEAFNAGYARVKDLNWDAIGSIDGDISFAPDLFAYLLQKLTEDPGLGIVGAPFRDTDTQQSYDYRFVSIEHVSGCCQLFRRECFEQIGGYVPVRGGGIDLIAVVTARMKGWKTRTFPERVCLHHRKMGTAQDSALRVWFKTGAKDYALGCHPVWEMFRTMYQMTKKPYVLGGALLAAGYSWSLVRRAERPMSREVREFRQREQMQRLKRFLGGLFTLPQRGIHSDS